MESLRPLLVTYAYNIIGSMEEAKDVVQNAFLKFMRIDKDRIEDKKAYLIRTVINLSINQKKDKKNGSQNIPVNGCRSPLRQRWPIHLF